MNAARMPCAIAQALLGLVNGRSGQVAARKDVATVDRREIPGRVVRLSAGRTRYELHGPVSGKPVVLVHGFTSPTYVWGDLPARLRRKGYRTLAYDLYGRGLSDRPDVVYDRDLYARQLLELLDQLRLRQPVHLVGLSMGGIIAADFALRHSARVASLTLIDPAGFSAEIPGAAALLTVPWVGDWLMWAFGERLLVAGNAKAVHDKSLVPRLRALFEPQLRYRGYKRAVLSSARSMPLADFTDGYRKLTRRRLPVQVFWGKRDEVTPLAGAAVAARLLPRATLTLVEGAGHLCHYEKPDVVVPVLLDFLGRTSPRRRVAVPRRPRRVANATSRE